MLRKISNKIKFTNDPKEEVKDTYFVYTDVWDQAENRLHAQKAVLLKLLE